MTIDRSSLSRSLLFVLSLACLFVFAACGGDNLLKNSRFKNWKNVPEEWSVEGPATVLKTGDGGAVLKSESAASPFLYQQIRLRKGPAERLITLAAWVKSDVPDSTVIEFSDRLGTDRKSAAHPGDNDWHLLKMTVRANSSSGIVEFRVRNYKGGTVYIREASVSLGSNSLLEKASEPAFALNGTYKTLAYASIFAVFGLTVRWFRNLRRRAEARAAETVLLLFIMTGFMLMIGRPAYAAITANIACGAFIIFMICYIRSRLSVNLYRGAALGELKKPGALFILFSVLIALVSLYALHHGDVSAAERAAEIAWGLMIIGSLATFFLKIPVSSRKPSLKKTPAKEKNDEGSPYKTALP